MRYLLDFFLFTIGLLAIAGLASGDDDDHGDYRSLASAPKNPAYVAECGGCHMAYPPSLLPARSWDALMAGLDDHFGDNAELPADDAARIRTYLMDHAADRAGGRGTAFARSVPAGDAPLRITDTPYFRRKHDEVPLRVVETVPEIGSFSNCQACHRGAQKGSFDEHAVRIPGYGRWDD